MAISSLGIIPSSQGTPPPRKINALKKLIFENLSRLRLLYADIAKRVHTWPLLAIAKLVIYLPISNRLIFAFNIFRIFEAKI